MCIHCKYKDRFYRAFCCDDLVPARGVYLGIHLTKKETQIITVELNDSSLNRLLKIRPNIELSKIATFIATYIAFNGYDDESNIPETGDIIDMKFDVYFNKRLERDMWSLKSVSFVKRQDTPVYPEEDQEPAGVYLDDYGEGV